MSPPIVGMNRMVPEGEAKFGVDIEIPSADESHTSDARLISNEPGCTSERTSPTHSILQYTSRFFIHSTVTILNLRRRYRGHYGQSYFCKESSCNYRRFSDKGALKRHSREVHGSEVHYCPFVSCNRHKKGFPRKYNFLAHQKRCHRDQFVTSSQQGKVPHSHAVEKAEHDRIPAGWLEQSNDEVNHESGTDTKSRRGEALIGEERLRRKLQNLKELRAEMNRDIDHDIEILEGALDIMMENSS